MDAALEDMLGHDPDDALVGVGPPRERQEGDELGQEQSAQEKPEQPRAEGVPNAVPGR